MTREEKEQIGKYVLQMARLLEDGCYQQEMLLKAVRIIDEALEQEPCEDVISRKSIKQKLQEHHDFFVDAYGGFSNLPQNDKSRVDEITNCIAMVVNEPSATPQEPRWIPVGEKLPKEADGKVLISINNVVSTGEYSEYSNRWYIGDMMGVGGDNPTAWMPLPQPYEPQESEGKK